jgi:enoyl-CoA hydratase/carnithine racemase
MSVSQQQEDPGVALDTGTDELLCRVADGVALVTLNKPHKKNALGDELTPALRALLPVLEQDARVGCILLTGAGDAFCAGGDVSEMGQGNPSANPSAESPAPTSVEQRVATLTEKQMQLTHRLYHLKKITIAALPGAAAGAGLSIALACDLRVGSERAFITTAFRNIGLSGDYGASLLAWVEPKRCFIAQTGLMRRPVRRGVSLMLSSVKRLFGRTAWPTPKTLLKGRVRR